MSNPNFKFTCAQISEFHTVLENHGIEVPSIEDSASNMAYSELLLTMVRGLDRDQADQLFQEV